MRLTFLAGLLLAASAQAADLPDSHDLAALPRFPHAEITDFRESPDQERVYPQSSIRRISNQLRMERKVEADEMIVESARKTFTVMHDWLCETP